ncbi:hypothetical protein [Clostridium sp. Marseille-Q2269]|uniref:hypothetical protein n=1 Tax=Clostridium sp. Marseille-Q2269 TaxID=2942205 RepID=UPI0033654D0D
MLSTLSQFSDLIMFDIKSTDNEIHKKFVGVDNSLILKNLEQLSKIHKNIILIIPLIPGINDTYKNIEKIIELALKNNIKEIHILPYHSLGKEKYNQLNKEYSLQELRSPDNDKVDRFKTIIEKNNIKCVVGG